MRESDAFFITSANGSDFRKAISQGREAEPTRREKVEVRLIFDFRDVEKQGCIRESTETSA